MPASPQAGDASIALPPNQATQVSSTGWLLDEAIGDLSQGLAELRAQIAIALVPPASVHGRFRPSGPPRNDHQLWDYVGPVVLIRRHNHGGVQ